MLLITTETTLFSNTVLHLTFVFLVITCKFGLPRFIKPWSNIENARVCDYGVSLRCGNLSPICDDIENAMFYLRDDRKCARLSVE